MTVSAEKNGCLCDIRISEIFETLFWKFLDIVLEKENRIRNFHFLFESFIFKKYFHKEALKKNLGCSHLVSPKGWLTFWDLPANCFFFFWWVHSQFAGHKKGLKEQNAMKTLELWTRAEPRATDGFHLHPRMKDAPSYSDEPLFLAGGHGSTWQEASGNVSADVRERSRDSTQRKTRGGKSLTSSYSSYPPFLLVV